MSSVSVSSAARRGAMGTTAGLAMAEHTTTRRGEPARWHGLRPVGPYLVEHRTSSCGYSAAVAEDYDNVIAVVDDWWGRPVSSSLPRLVFEHLWPTSTIAEDKDGLAGFLVGFISPAQPEVGYVHFVGVRPDRRRSGLARLLYGRGCARQGCCENPGRNRPVECCLGPVPREARLQ